MIENGGGRVTTGVLRAMRGSMEPPGCHLKNEQLGGAGFDDLLSLCARLHLGFRPW